MERCTHPQYPGPPQEKRAKEEAHEDLGDRLIDIWVENSGVSGPEYGRGAQWTGQGIPRCEYPAGKSHELSFSLALETF